MTNEEMSNQIMRCFVGTCDETCKFYDLMDDYRKCNCMDIVKDVDNWLKEAAEALNNKENIMNEELYEVYCDNTKIAGEMTLGVAVLLVKTYFQEYNLDSFSMTIKKQELTIAG